MKKIILTLMMIMLAPVSPLLNQAHSVETNADYTTSPPFIGEGVPPLVMMVMGRDHKLYYEAYNDASDIDDDGQLDIGYKHSIDYYGYFDSYKCYKYDSTGTAKFAPFQTNTDKKCGGADEWSGNFLNWLTTSRIDALRKVMYGGYRSTDSTSLTVLEGEYRPQDAHSWGKEVNGAELVGATVRDLTPFDDPAGGILPTAAVTWGGAGYDQKILLVTYDDSQINKYGNDHNDLVASYSLCDYKSYSYITEFNDASITNSAAGKTYSRRINSNHIDTGNFFLVTEFEVTAANNGNWSFAVDGDDGVEVEIDGTVVASYYGNHAECWTQTTPQPDPATACNASQIKVNVNLGVGWHRMIVRHRENTGNDGVKVYYKKPADASWIVFGASKNVANANITQLTYRAPNVLSTESIRFMKDTFINTGEPAYDATGTGAVTCNNKRHLYCVTSLGEDATPVFRLLKDKTNRIWEWASKERPVCDTSLGVPADYFVRVKVCDPAIGLESNCKTYPNGANPNKPTGLFQKYGESTEKVCSKSFTACNTDSDCAGSPERCIDRGQMFFGLMTGSYTKNLSGGVLRWNLDSITHAVDNRNVGQIKTASDNLISTLNKMRIKGFRYSDYSYQDTGANCGWITGSALSEGQCRMWGNPVAEMMYEAERYFGGKGTPTTDFSAGTDAVGTDDRVLGLPNAGENPTADNNWTAPYLKYPSCSKPFVIVLSDVNPSYDSDQLPGVDSDFGAFAGDLPGLNVKTIADAIGVEEGINGTNAFIGQVDAATDTVCSSKGVTSLGSIRGLCPEEPTKKGSYYSAAVANYGKTQFSADTGNPNITTYSVALVSPVPEIKINVNGKEIKIIPVGKSVSGVLQVYENCFQKSTMSYTSPNGLSISNLTGYCPSNQIVDFYIDTLTTDYGNFRVNFEDVEQGADHDMDAIVQYSYQVSGNNVTINLNSAYAAGGIDQVMGFVITGTTEDGLYLPVKDADTSGTADINTPAVVAGMPTSWSYTFTASATGSTANLLKDPLWYAAKWGGFEDRNSNNKPDLQDEWDKVDNVTGAEGGDGEPDTYFKISNPLKMEQQLTKVFSDILKKSASGTSVSILATSAEGEGALYQAYFYPEKVMTDGSKRGWLGYCRGLFLDAYGNLRDDCSSANPLSCNSTPDAKLIFNKDNILRMKLDTATNEVKADLYRDADEDGSADNATADTSIGVDEMAALWEAGKKLALRDKGTRYIYTWVDLDNDGKVDNGDFSIWGGEARDLWDSWTLMPYLKADPIPWNWGPDPWMDAWVLTEYIRGTDWLSQGWWTSAKFRNRCIPVPGATTEWTCSGATDRVWPLGDIIYSTPTVVSGAREQYDQIYGGKAANYSAFRSKYNNRRHVVYVGSNDGMLHAFNAGVYTAGDDTLTGDTEHGLFTPNPASGNGWTWPLPTIGDELWAFVPYDNLPHLKWLTHGDYSHVYYVDLKPKPTDVRIFCDSDGSLNPPVAPNCVDGQANASHPGGWGTILIVGMRLGGGAIGVDLNGDGDTLDAGETFRSSYYALDVTDPEKPPKLLWRFTDANLGFTTSYPGIIHIEGTPDKWFMVVGSGPDNNAPPATRGYSGESSQQGRIYIVNLLDGTKAMTFSKLGKNNSGVSLDSNAFFGDPTVVDGDLDFTSDVVYIGSAISITSGKVHRINTHSDPDPTKWELSEFINQVKPLLVGESISKDATNNLWVFFGTGRLWRIEDKTNSDQQKIYGIKDGCWKGGGTTRLSTVDANNDVTLGASDTACPVTYTLGNLLNVSSTEVKVATGDTQISGFTTGTVSYQTLISRARAAHGWYSNLTDPAGPSERVISKSVILGGVVLFTTFTPNPDPCSFQGDSNLYALYYETGTAYIKPVIGTTGSGATETILKSQSLGKGMPTTVGVAVGKKTKGFIQTSTGTIVEVEAQPALGIRSGPLGWREKTGGGGSVEIEEIYKHIVK